jgi:hypothetical protein
VQHKKRLDAPQKITRVPKPLSLTHLSTVPISFCVVSAVITPLTAAVMRRFFSQSRGLVVLDYQNVYYDAKMKSDRWEKRLTHLELPGL